MIVLAGGVGARLGADRNKVYLTVAGREILAYSLATLAEHADLLVLVVRPDERDHALALAAELIPGAPVRVTAGGATRHESEYAGLCAVAAEIDAGDVDVVGIHDGARPFASTALTTALTAAVSNHDGAIPAVPFDDTVYHPDDGRFVDTDDLVRVQTPQVFRAPVVLDAHRQAAVHGFEGVDTAQVLERFTAEASVVAVPGEATNIKVTVATDMDEAETIAAGGTPAESARPDVRVRVGDVRALSGEVVGFGSEELSLPDGVDARFSTIPATDAVKRVRADGVIVETVDRASLRLVRPPEVVRRSVLLEAIAGRSDDEVVNPSRAVADGGGGLSPVADDQA